MISVSITIVNYVNGKNVPYYFSSAFMNNQNVTLPDGMDVSVIAESLDRQAELVLIRG